MHKDLRKLILEINRHIISNNEVHEFQLCYSSNRLTIDLFCSCGKMNKEIRQIDFFTYDIETDYFFDLIKRINDPYYQSILLTASGSKEEEKKELLKRTNSPTIASVDI